MSDHIPLSSLVRHDEWQRRRARRLKSVTSRREELMDTSCIYCGGPAEHLDHVMPRSRGGVATVPACAPCNLSKRDQTPTEWIMRLRLRELDGKPNKVDVFKIQSQTPAHLFDSATVERAVDDRLFQIIDKVWRLCRDNGQSLGDWVRGIEHAMADMDELRLRNAPYPDGVVA